MPASNSDPSVIDIANVEELPVATEAATTTTTTEKEEDPTTTVRSSTRYALKMLIKGHECMVTYLVVHQGRDSMES